MNDNIYCVYFYFLMFFFFFLTHLNKRNIPELTEIPKSILLEYLEPETRFLLLENNQKFNKTLNKNLPPYSYQNNKWMNIGKLLLLRLIH